MADVTGTDLAPVADEIRHAVDYFVGRVRAGEVNDIGLFLAKHLHDKGWLRVPPTVDDDWPIPLVTSIEIPVGEALLRDERGIVVARVRGL